MKQKSKKFLIEGVQSSAANFCYEHNEQDFDIILSVHAEDGWVKVKEIKPKVRDK